MKALAAFSVLCLSTVVACTHSSSVIAGLPSLPPMSTKAAAGAINGQAMQFLGGSYSLVKDNKGNTIYNIFLTANAADGCMQSADGIYIMAPAQVGQSTFPQSYANFVYMKNGTEQNDIASSLVVNITADDGVTVSGSIDAQMDGSNVNGTFSVSQCGTAAPGPRGNPTPVGASDPAATVAIPAQAWSDVKYAFCSAQGQSGILIDFQGTDLSTASHGNFQMGQRQCGSSQPFQWQNSAAFAVTTNGTTITLDFGNDPNTGTANTIEIDNNDFINANGIMDGNSGPCTLLSNEGTQGLFQSYPDFACQ